MASRPDFLTAALGYAERDIPVFPLGPRSKVPLIATKDGGKSLHDATTDPDQITEWWSRKPDANIGLRTGVVFDVVDLDGPEAVKAITAARGTGERLTGPSVKTPRGWHVLVKPSGAGNRAGILPRVDYRGLNGYVVGAGSINAQCIRYQ